MSMSKNIARLAVTAGLTAALSFGGVMAPVTMAFAEDATPTTNTITINNNIADNRDVEYKAYQIFTASVVDESGNPDKVVSNVKWAASLDNNAQAKADIIEAIREAPGGDSLSGTPSAQDIANWLSDKKNVNTSTSTCLEKDHVLNKIAKAIIDNKITQTGNSFKAGHSFTAPSNGYYLFVTDESSLMSTAQNAKENAGTSPIFAVVGGTGVTVTEKTSIPTIDKKILNDVKESKDGYTAQKEWSNVADSQVGQEVSYKLTGSIADNYAAYDSYEYKFTDTLSQGLTYDEGSLEVYALNDQNYTKISPKSYTVDAPDEGDNTLTVSFTNKGLKSATAANESDALNINANTYIVVFYRAKLNSKASYEVTGNNNEVYLEYSNNPMAAGTGKSVTKVVTDHVFRLDVTKVDSEDTNKKLQAGFKVMVMDGEGSEDADSQGKWLAKDGTLVEKDKAYEFTTDETSGQIYIPGLDAGKYQITETTTPKGYNTIAPVTITVAPDYDDNGNLTGLNVSDNSGMVDTNNVTNATDATITVTIRNKKGSSLPLTGLNGVTFTWIAGGAVLCIGVAHLIRSRKQAEESEQE